MLNSKIQTLTGFAAGHQTPQMPDRKSRTAFTKLLSYIDVESTTMILCLIQTYVLLQDLSDKKVYNCLTWKSRFGNLKGHKISFK